MLPQPCSSGPPMVHSVFAVKLALDRWSVSVQMVFKQR